MVKPLIPLCSNLKLKDRLNELARLLGGDSITEHTLANAQELLVS